MKLVATIVVALCASLTFVRAADGDETPAPTVKPTPPPTVKPSEKTTKCQTPEAMADAKQLPDLPPTFQTTIESKFLKGTKGDFKPHVMLVREFTDSDKKKRAVFVADGKNEKNRFFDLAQGDAFFLKDDKCDSEKYKNVDTGADTLYFKFSSDADGKVGTMLGLEDIYNFSIKAQVPVQTNNNASVRGIECGKWSTCFNWEKFNKDFVVDFYWSTNTVMPQRENTPTPVRMEVKGYDEGITRNEGSLRYHHVYDFINFQDTIGDPSVFWPEVKHLCGDHEYYESHGNQKHTFPGIKDAFSVDSEQITSTTDKITVMRGKYVMDKVNKLMRTDLEVSKEDTSFYSEKCGRATGVCKVMHDFTVGLEYIIKQDGSCSIYSIPVKNTKAGNLPGDILQDQTHKKDDQPTYVTMASGYHLFSVGNGTTGDHLPMEYQGQRRFREVDVDAWAARYSDDDQYREIFLRDGKLWGMIQNSKPDTTKDTWISSRINFFNYDEAPDMSAFDIHYCFSNKDQMSEAQQETFKTIHGKLTLKEKWSDIQKIGMWKVQQKLREKLAEKAGVNPLRITDMMLSKDGKKDDSDVILWFTILWASPISGSVWNEGTPSAQMPVDKAEKALEDAIDKEDIGVNINNDAKVTIKKDSLKTDEDTMKDDPRASQGNVIKTGHSNNAMAGVGISMLLLGAVIGLGVGFYMWKRRGRGVPYQIHH